MKIQRKFMGYSNEDHRFNPDTAEINYAVPFIGQNHANICSDAAIGMLLRWARHHDVHDENLNVFSMMSGRLGLFIKSVQRIERLAEDKLRNEDQYLTVIINQCRAVKAARDPQYGGGFSLRKRR